MLFLTIPTANTHPELLENIIAISTIPRERIVLIATRPNLDLPNGCTVIEDLGQPNIQRWWNRGIEESIKRGATAVAVLNDDLVINEYTLHILHNELIRTKATISSPTRADWGPGLYKDSNIFPYTPVIWGCLWLIDATSRLRPDPNYVWWFGDSDLDIRARRDHSGIATADVYYEHFFAGEGTKKSEALSAQTNLDAKTFESNYKEFLRSSRSTPSRKLFIQAQQFPARINAESSYREDFFHYVCSSGDPKCDRVVLVEPNTHLHQSIKEMWSQWSNVLIIEKCLVSDEVSRAQTHVSMFRLDDPTHHSRLSTFALDVHRFGPHLNVEKVQIPTITFSNLIQEVSPGAELRILAFDARVNSLQDISFTKSQAVEIIVITSGLGDKSLDEEAKGLGLHSVGRPWGEARTCAAFSYQRKSPIRSLRTAGGHFASSLVDTRKQITSRNYLTEFFKSKVGKGITRADVLDSNHGLPISAISRHQVDVIASQASGATNEPDSNDFEWQVPVDTDSQVQELAQKCFTTHGVWPLSMSIPTHLAVNPHPTELVSPLIPGYPYSFHSEAEYLAKYADAYLALTHRKAGWDCFRHVEIMASGSVPLMPDSDQIPEFAMVHYPKQAFAKVSQKVQALGGRPNGTLRTELREFFLSHLTTKAMSDYILAAAQIPADASILFLDENLPSNPEYMSTLTAIGLKENLGNNCVLHFPGEFLYADSPAETHNFYGRGFGYVKHLDPGLRSDWEDAARDSLEVEEIDFSQYDFVVVGSVSRNMRLTQTVLKKFPASKTVLIHGEDTPPTIATAHFLRSTKAHVFIRSIY